ncbi:MAG TPA: TetR family transcriptional regulator [Bauldia sp.]|nr:TetR family transcriptional regulator [Bauldia sp.]
MAILDAVETLLAETPFEDISVIAVAKAAHLAKGTVYLYFPSREAMFLALFLRRTAAFASELTSLLRSSRKARGLAEAIAKRLSEEPLLLRLMALAPTVLERNIDVATAGAFKHGLVEALAPATAAFEARGHPPGEGFRFLLRLNALAVGYAELAEPSAAVAAAIAGDPALAPLRIDFVRELSATLAVLLEGTPRGQ